MHVVWHLVVCLDSLSLLYLLAHAGGTLVGRLADERSQVGKPV